MMPSLFGRLLAVSVIGASSLEAQTVGTVVIAHGGDSIWNAHVRETVALAKTPGPIEVSFLMGPDAPKARFQDAVAKLTAKGADRVVVVPMLVSSHSGHYEQIRYLARLTDSLDVVMQHHLHHGGIQRVSSSIPITVAPALDASTELATVLTERARAMQPDPRGRALMLMGHGPNSAEDYASWMANLRVVADSVRRWSGFRDVRIELVREDAPPHVRAEAIQRLRELISLQAELTGQDVTVVPILISRGGISRSRVMLDLAELPIEYSGDPILPHPAMARWIEASVARGVNR